MKQFLDTIDSHIFILNKNLETIFCNSKLLNKLRCDEDKISKIEIKNNENKHIKYIIKDIKNEECINTSLRLYFNEVAIEIESKMISGYFQDQEVIFVSGSRLKIINYKDDVENKTLEENLKEEIESSEKLVEILNNILDKIDEDISFSEILKNIDITQIVKKTLGEIHKVDLLKKEIGLLLNVSADLFGAIGCDGRLKTTSQAWTNCLGWSEEEFLSTNILDLVHEIHKEKFMNLLNVENEDVNIIEIKIKCKDGTYKWLRWNLKLVVENDSFIFIIRDITKEKIEENERKKLEEAIYLETIKNEFFANMSHEFKTPLNIILGTMQLLDKKISSGSTDWKKLDLDRYVNLIRQNSYRLLRLVNNLMDMTKIDTGYYELRLDNHDIVSVVEGITLSVAHYIEGKQIELIFDTNCEENIICCDPEKIERILLNLLSNAIKYTEVGGHIYVDLEVNEEHVNISVKDDGEGISSEKLPIIFDRFVQGDSTLTRAKEGSGIGLSLAKSLVEMHHGKIKVCSQEGIGTEFEFSLPNKTTSIQSYNFMNSYISENNKIEMCNIEFSDIYGM